MDHHLTVLTDHSLQIDPRGGCCCSPADLVATFLVVLGEAWPDQYKRLQRSYALLRRTADPQIEREELHQQDNALDILYHFCSDAMNLRDWIARSEEIQQVREEVFYLFKVEGHPDVASSALAACADIANGAKHFELTRKPYTPGGPAEVTSQTQCLKLPFTLPSWFSTNHWVIDVGGVEHDALDLAAQAVADWDNWLTNHGLLPLPS